MRFREFVNFFTEAKGQSGYYTVGDSHAEGLAAYSGKPWTNMAKRGTASTDPMHMNAIRSIPSGSVVLISVGANDTFAGKNVNPTSIAGNVANLVNAATAKGLKVYFLLFPVGTRANAEVRKQTREAIKSSISVPIIDLEGSRLVDGVHADSASYRSASSRVLGSAKPSTGQAPMPTEEKPKDRINKTSELTKGPPYPREQRDEVSAMQSTLQELGYSLGKPGVDGKYGPYTAAAVAAFKKDYGIKGSGDTFGSEEFKVVDQIKSGQTKKVKASTPQPLSVDNLPELRNDAVTQGKIGQLLNLIAGPESGGHYDMMFGSKRYPKILDMTLSQLLAFQSQYKSGNITGHSMETAAAGRYQFMPNTLVACIKGTGMNPNTEKFSPENQDKLIIYRLRSVRGLDQWLSGKISNERFMDNLAKEFASFPAPSKGGKSWYDKVGSNKAGVKMASVDAKLDQIQSMA